MSVILNEGTLMDELTDRSLTILVVDDDPLGLEIATSILDNDFTIVTAMSGAETIEKLKQEEPSLVLLDLHMPGMDGRSVLEQIQANDEWKEIPIVFMTSDSSAETKRECIAMGAVDFILKPFVPEVVLSRVRHAIELASLRQALQREFEEKTKLLERSALDTIMTISAIIDARDEYTSGHSDRVALCAMDIAKKLGWSEEDAKNLYLVALLHDIGKVGIPDAILNKPSKLTDEEYHVIQQHPVIGQSILKGLYMLKKVNEGALYHHERYDGNGYPAGLKGEDIPLYARIIGIADSYDAMSSDRVYRSKLPHDKIIAEFERCRGTQFDPELDDLFVSMLKDGYPMTRS